MDDNSLEKVVFGILHFSSEKKLSSNIRVCLRLSGNSTYRDLMEISLEDPDTESGMLGRQHFRHFVYFYGNGKMKSQRTCYVEDDSRSRGLYREFISYMQSLGILLTNGFEDLWKDNPSRYFIAV